MVQLLVKIITEEVLLFLADIATGMLFAFWDV